MLTGTLNRLASIQTLISFPLPQRRLPLAACWVLGTLAALEMTSPGLTEHCVDASSRRPTDNSPLQSDRSGSKAGRNPSEQPDPTLGVIAGTITYQGEIPKQPIADNNGQRRDLITVKRKNGGLRDVIVFMDVPPSPAKLTPDADDTPAQRPNQTDSQEKDAARRAAIDQRDYTFLPNVIAVLAGQEVAFTNSDGGNHNVRAAAIDPRNQFNVTTSAGGSYVHRFHAQRKHRPIQLSCDIHPWMRAWVYVFEHPFYAVSDADGHFEIPNVPAGRHTVQILQPDVAVNLVREVEVAAGKTSNLSLGLTAKDFKLR